MVGMQPKAANHRGQPMSQHFYILSYASEGPGKVGNSQVLGVFSTLELAKIEAQRYDKKKPLEWVECDTDEDVKCYWNANLPNWHSKTNIEIWKHKLDKKKFRI